MCNESKGRERMKMHCTEEDQGEGCKESHGKEVKILKANETAETTVL